MTFQVHRRVACHGLIECFTIPSNPRRLSPCNQPYLTFFLPFSSFLSFNLLTYVRLALITNSNKESEMSLPNKKQAAKPTATQAKIAQLKLEIATHMKRLISESWRNLIDTDENRAMVERMVKGASVKYGPRLKQAVDTNWKFDAAMLMYQPRASLVDGLDLDDFLATGEQYNGETHLRIMVSFDTWLILVRREYNGIVGPNEKTLNEAAHLKRLYTMVRILRHVETFSCWRNEGTNKDTGETFLFAWPKEEAAFTNNFYRMEVIELAYATDDINSFRTKYRARETFEKDERPEIDNGIHPEDVRRATTREHNQEIREAKRLGNLIGE